MTTPVDPDTIERLVGVPRQELAHVARLTGDTVWLMHSRLCLSRDEDLTQCPYSQALDETLIKDVRWPEWASDTPVLVAWSPYGLKPLPYHPTPHRR